MAYRTTTPDPFDKVAKLELDACHSGYKSDKCPIVTAMNDLTLALISPRESKPAEWCPRMFELEAVYGYHERKLLTIK